MTLEDFAHICLMIKAGYKEAKEVLDIPCCANCKYYQKVWDDDLPAIWVCKRIDPHWIKDMKPEDFCSRWESRNEEKEVKKETKRLVDTSKGPDDAPPSCETCKYNGFDILFADSPCFGCVVTEGNFKMYEPKETIKNE